MLAARARNAPVADAVGMWCVWHGIETPSVERLELTDTPDGVLARSTVETPGEQYEYEVTLGPDWVLRALFVRTMRRALDLRRDPAGSWSLYGEPHPDLADAVDVDLSFSPFTNTLPIRRLALDVGDSAEIVTAYVEAETLAVTPDPQRYTRLTEDRYVYESLDSDFRRTITVDTHGLVVAYPGLYRREG